MMAAATSFPRLMPGANPVSRRTIGTLAERLFRRNLAAQYVASDHSFMGVEDRLIADSVEEIRGQLLGRTPLHLEIARIHLRVMDDAEFLSQCDDVEDVDEDTLRAAIAGVEKDSLDILARLCVPV